MKVVSFLITVAFAIVLSAPSACQDKLSGPSIDRLMLENIPRPNGNPSQGRVHGHANDPILGGEGQYSRSEPVGGTSRSSPNEIRPSTRIKRGLAYNNAKLTHLFSSKVASWGYNWASTPVAPGFQGPFANGHEYVPMLYNGSDSDWEDNVERAVTIGSKHLLAMNEPDQPPGAGGTQISPQDAAQIYKCQMNKYSDRLKLGAPGVSAGGVAWLKSFAQVCNGSCHVDFVPLHFYNDDISVNIQVESMKGWLEETIPQVRQMFDNPDMPIWVTEFAALPLNTAATSWMQMNVQYMNKILPYLDANQAIARYSYYYVDSLARGDQLNAAGKRYTTK